MKICRFCGTQLPDHIIYCTHCGAHTGVPEPVRCERCGMLLYPGSVYCPSCCTPVPKAESQQSGGVIDKLNDLTGVKGNTKINLRDCFSDVFRHHTPEETDRLFICGTQHTTPREADMVVDWPRPWLFSRIFLLSFGVLAALILSFVMFKNLNIVPGFMFFGAIIVPFSYLIFIWECNIPRNISIFSVMRILFLGGGVSIFVTLLLNMIFPDAMYRNDYVSAVITSLVEETAKALIVIHYIRRLNTKYILNGILIGAAVGAGFAAFETAGYICFSGMYDLLVNDSIKTMLETSLLRGSLAIGGHCAWAAIIGGAVSTVKRDKPFSFSMLSNSRVWGLLAIPLVLHALWDMPFFGTNQMLTFLFLATLTALALTVLFILLSAGIREVRQIADERAREEMMAAQAMQYRQYPPVRPNNTGSSDN